MLKISKSLLLLRVLSKGISTYRSPGVFIFISRTFGAKNPPQRFTKWRQGGNNPILKLINQG